MNSLITRSTLAALFSLLITAFGHAQENVRVVWHDSDEGPQWSSFSRSIALPGGDVVCFGNRDGATGYELVIIRFDPDGTKEWTTTLPTPFGTGSVLVSRVSLADNGDMIVLATVTGGATIRDLYLLRISQSGILLDDEIIDQFDSDSGTDMKIGPAGNIVISAYDFGDTQYLAMKVDPSFQVLWSVDLGIAGHDHQYPTDLAITPNGDVLVAGVVWDGVDQDVRIDRLSPADGALVYSKDFGDANESDYDPIVCAGSNGGTYFAFRKAAFGANPSARLYRLDSAGNVEWGMTDGDRAWFRIMEIDNDEFIAVAVGPFDGVKQTFRRFSSDGTILGTRVITLEGYQHNWLRRVAIGPDDIIYTMAHATADGGTGPDWYVNGVTIEGDVVFHWAFDGGEESYDYGNGLTPLGNGALLVCGETGSLSDDDAHVFRLQTESLRPPHTSTVEKGYVRGGDVDSLTDIDNNRYQLCASHRFHSQNEGLEVILNGTVDENYPGTDISFSLTGRVSFPQLPITIDFWNWNTQRWEFGTRVNLTTMDTTTIIPGSYSRHVNVDSAVRARIRGLRMNSTSQGAYCLAIDQAAWVITP